MILAFSLPDLSTDLWISLLICAFLIGAAKAGIKGIGTLTIPILAQAFGAKASVGLLLPILILADLMAVRYYRRDAEWKYIWMLMPAAAIGVLLAVWVGAYMDDDLFRIILAVVILGSLLLLVLQEAKLFSTAFAEHKWTARFAGFLGGFTTMIGNAAGPVMNVYLLSIKLPKNSFIGTAAWFFLVINLFKFPFHVFVWETIDLESLYLNILSLPLIILGFVFGIYVVRLIPEKAFRYFVMVMTAVAALRLLF